MFAFGRDAESGKEVFFMEMPPVNAEGTKPTGFGICPECQWLFPATRTEITNFDSDETFIPYRMIYHLDGWGSLCSGSWAEPGSVSVIPSRNN